MSACLPVYLCVFLSAYMRASAPQGFAERASIQWPEHQPHFPQSLVCSPETRPPQCARTSNVNEFLRENLFWGGDCYLSRAHHRPEAIAAVDDIRRLREAMQHVSEMEVELGRLGDKASKGFTYFNAGVLPRICSKRHKTRTITCTLGNVHFIRIYVYAFHFVGNGSACCRCPCLLHAMLDEGQAQ